MESILTSNDSTKRMTEVGRVVAGEGFGEIALITPGNTKRQATIKCITPCHLATISKHDYIRIFKRIDEKIKDEAISFYRLTPYFSHWSRAMLLKLLYCFKPKQVKKGQVIIREGFDYRDHGRFMYLIKDGDFEVIKKLKVSNTTAKGDLSKAELDPLTFLSEKHSNA